MQWWKIINQTNDNAELLLYGDIGDGWPSDNSSKDFATALQDLKSARNVTIRINSPGGEVSAAQAIYSLIKNHPANVTIVIDGLAASAASLIAMAGDRIIMPVNALMMIHNPMTCIAGDSGDMMHTADILKKTKETMISVYSERTGKDSKTLSDMMDAETWMTAEEALRERFIDEVDRNTVVNYFTGKSTNTLVVNNVAVDFTKYRHIPMAVMTATKKPRPIQGRKQEENIMNVKQLKKQHPDIYNQIYNIGVAAERRRIKEIDSIHAPGCDRIKHKAKYEQIRQPGNVALDIVNAQTAKRTETARKYAKDVHTSRVNKIPSSAAPGSEQSAAKGLIKTAVKGANANVKKGSGNK